MCEWIQFNRYNELCTAKLAHYNAWLADHEFGTTYPGFPQQDELDAMTGKKTITVLKPPVKETKVYSEPKSVNHKSGTKLEQAIELFKNSADQSRDTIVALFMSKLNMSKAGATTYYYNAKKGA